MRDVLKTIGPTVTAMVALITAVWVLPRQPEPLVAEADLVRLDIPSTVSDQLVQKIRELSDLAATVVNDVTNDPNEARRLQNTLKVFAEQVENRAIEVIQRAELMDGLVWRVRLVNEGTTVLSSIKLRLPRAQLAEIRRDGKPLEENSAGEIIELGTLNPGEEVGVTAWAPVEETQSSVSPGVSHASGHGLFLWPSYEYSPLRRLILEGVRPHRGFLTFLVVIVGIAALYRAFTRG